MNNGGVALRATVVLGAHRPQTPAFKGMYLFLNLIKLYSPFKHYALYICFEGTKNYE
jgi:hypothetical protein